MAAHKLMNVEAAAIFYVLHTSSDSETETSDDKKKGNWAI
jgi:hypothetical protein